MDRPEQVEEMMPEEAVQAGPTAEEGSSDSKQVEQKRSKKPTHELAKILDEYIASLNAMMMASSLMTVFVLLGTVHTREKITKTMTTVKNSTGREGADAIRSLDGGPLLAEVMKAFSTSRPFLDSFHTLPPGFVITMVSQYDYLLSRVDSYVLKQIPGILESSDRKFTFSELQSFASLEEAREALLEREVETLLRQSHHAQIEDLEKKLDMKLRVGLTVWPEFIELTQRRNILTHTKGLISRQYLSVCKVHGVAFEEPLKVGDRLTVDTHYLQRSHQILFEMGVKLMLTVWKKLEKNSEDADKLLSNIGYELIRKKQFDLAIVVLEFAFRQKKIATDNLRKTIAINLANAYRLADKPTKAAEIVGGIDWTSSAPTFSLGVACIRGDHAQAASLMRRVDAQDVGKLEYHEWPLFDGFRDSPEFKLAYEEIFKEKFEPIVDAPPDDRMAAAVKAIEAAFDSAEPAEPQTHTTTSDSESAPSARATG